MKYFSSSVKERRGEVRWVAICVFDEGYEEYLYLLQTSVVGLIFISDTILPYFEVFGCWLVLKRINSSSPVFRGTEICTDVRQTLR